MKSELTKPRLIIIVGPTGVGKTELALKCAATFGGEIISADSMQVYRYMDIGTAKPTIEERQSIPHHLIDIVNPDEPFNAALFVESASPVIESIVNRGGTIFLVGGTGLYVRSLVGGLFECPRADEELREAYRRDLMRYGSGYLHEQLRDLDAEAARKIHRNDVVRIIRALEVIEQTGESIIRKQEEHRFADRRYDYVTIGLTVVRSLLYEKINSRADSMISRGLVEEVETLLAKGYTERHKPMQSMCYKHIVDYLKGGLELSEAVRLIKRDTRRYAKRQLTWFKREEDIQWFQPTDEMLINQEIARFIER
ncbi:MAG: tRNA (adenosine(37)-N6)-dimethylallyltransferase MiaA [Deltaproteobacteria bacterium]|nr:tRNA (adenosine(37)-N6)-dimethylallyltransferase MiaA [Deltaproteobacteria bacterium]MBN2686887.1 tRNA (adenosine(37)-N6)-dimethylallyltransferase MiaA [Deltaproteobacteria bacterium]